MTSLRKVLFALALWPGNLHAADVFFLNAQGSEDWPYGITRFDSDGLPQSYDPVVELPSGYTHAAWPSAVRVGSQIKLYASVYIAGRWDSIRLWTADSVDGPYTDQGTALSHNPATEPYGIGPAKVTYDPSLGLYLMYFLVRGYYGPGQAVWVATSRDGRNWSRDRAVLRPSLYEELEGVSMSYSCKTSAGDYALFYHAYYAGLSKGVAVVATAKNYRGPFTEKAIIARPYEDHTWIVAADSSVVGLVPVELPIGVPLLIDPGGDNQEVNVVIKQAPNKAWFAYPFKYYHYYHDVISMDASKVDPSYVRELPDGSWQGVFTLYGPGTGIAAEYTTGYSSPSLKGMWATNGDGIRFSPFMPNGSISTENPYPLVENNSCAN